MKTTVELPAPLLREAKRVALKNRTTVKALIGSTQISRNRLVTGPRVHEARVAALCLRHGIRELWSADRDFSLFPQLTLRNPLV